MANFATGRLSEPVMRFTIEAVVACALGAQTVHSHYFPAYGLWGGTLGPDRISGSWVLARATERQSGRALSQGCGKVLRFPITRSLPCFSASLPVGSPRRFAGTVWCVPQMAHHISWTSRLVSRKMLIRDPDRISALIG